MSDQNRGDASVPMRKVIEQPIRMTAASPEELNKMAAAAYRTATTRAAQPTTPEAATSANASPVAQQGASTTPAQAKKE